MTDANDTGSSAPDHMTELVYELLDAHRDTVLLGDELVEDGQWAAHLDYLRGLQRVGHEALAQLSGMGNTEAHGLLRGD
jgi:hypothetical protein